MNALQKYGLLVFCLVAIVLGCARSADSPQAAPVKMPQSQPAATDTQMVNSEATPSIVGYETVVERYDDGQVKREYEVQVDSTDQRINHGSFVEFYPDGNRFCQGSYKNGQRDGHWQFWHSGSQLAREATYAMGFAEGTWTWYRPDGARLREKSYLHGKPHGDAIWYAADGESMTRKESYRDGQPHGIFARWHDNGHAASQVEFRNGVPDGRETRWHKNGSKRAEGNYKEGSPHGTFQYWSSDGKLIKSIQWKNGRRVSSAFPVSQK